MITLLGLITGGVALGSLGSILITVLIIAIFLAALYWVITTFFPAPIQRYAIGVVVVLAAVFLIWFLAGLGGLR